MKEIKLSREGKNRKLKFVALVDDEDFEELNKFNWYAGKGCHSYYARRSDKGKAILMHRVILGITDRKTYADHRDHNGLNNQRSNLRIANQSQNVLNVTSAKNSTSKYLGVCWLKNVRKWKAQIKTNYKNIHIGIFDKEIDAAIAYNERAKLIHGEFANLNII